ncbi:MAG: hypothetical protein GY853_16340 [PVC group bacterium]|nr:hypothetical protein [PVC group bacterium]
MKQTKKDRIEIYDTETNISIEYFEINEEDKAKERVDFLNDYHNGSMKADSRIINAYWNNGRPSQRRI